MSQKKPDQLAEGWVAIDGAGKWHWTEADRRVLCRRWLYLGTVAGDPTKDDHPENCQLCLKRLVKKRARA